MLKRHGVKKDPETPKGILRLGQFQQSPKIPLSQEPDLKEKGKPKGRSKALQGKLNIPKKTFKIKAREIDCVNCDNASKVTTKVSNKATNNKRFKKRQKICKKTNKECSKQKMSNSEYRANRKRLTEWIYTQESEHLGDIKESGKERAGKWKKALYFEQDSIPSKFMKLKDDKFTSINNKFRRATKQKERLLVK